MVDHGWPTPLKNMSSSDGIIIPKYMEKINLMFQTTSQIGVWWLKYLNMFPYKIFPMIVFMDIHGGL